MKMSCQRVARAAKRMTICNKIVTNIEELPESIEAAFLWY